MRAVIAALVAAAGGGCASAHTPTLTSRFVVQGTPAVDLGGPPVAAATARPIGPPAPMRAVRRSTTISADLEATDPRLKASLAATRQTPTLERQLEAARRYQRLGVIDRAIEYAEAGVQLAPHDAAAHDALARLWRDGGLPGLGLASAHRAVFLAPESAAARNTLGTVLQALGKGREAGDAFEAAVRLDRGAWFAWQNLCELSMRAGETKRAIVLCQRAAAERAHAREPRKEPSRR
jgi:tetratricopeptide (TPR) repeat protein